MDIEIVRHLTRTKFFYIHFIMNINNIPISENLTFLGYDNTLN